MEQEYAVEFHQLKTKSGKTGWVKGVKGIHSNPLIKESLFVG